MRSVLAIAALCTTLSGQALSIESAGGEGGAHVLAVDAREVAVLDVVARAAAVSGTRLNVDPDLLDFLATRNITVRRSRVLLDELALLCAAEGGFRARLEGGVLSLTPETGTKGGRPALGAALAQVEHAVTAQPEPQLMAALRFQRACLLLESGAPLDAAIALTELGRDFPGHAAGAEAGALAVAAYLRAGRHAEALEALDRLEESRQGIPLIPGADLLPARAHSAAGNWKEALVRARKAASSARSQRDRAIAGLMAAEIQQKLGDGEGMLASIRGLPAGFDRTFRDLSPYAELGTGAALRLLHDERAALLHLRVALRTVAPKLRGGVALMIAECFAALDEPVFAGIAIRQAEALETHPSELRHIRVRRAEIEESFGALGRASETCLGVLQGAQGPFPEAERVLATLARCLIANGRGAEARATLEALADREDWRGWALYKLAWVERASGEPEKALRALARLAPADLKPPGPSSEAVRKLRGDLLLDLGDPLQAAEVFRGSDGEAHR
jgi:tetratricopeptide (TPR) repeat protein